MKFFWSALFFIAITYFVTLNCRPLVTPDEFRYGEIAREMIENDNFFSPRLFTLRYFEKPVLTHQMNMVSLKLFGETPFGVRFAGAFLTVLTGLMTAALVWRRRRDGKLAWMSFGFFASFIWVYILGTTSLTDAPLSFFTTAALYSGFLAAVEGRDFLIRCWWCLLCALALTGAFYTKGAIGWALPGVALGGFLLWEKRFAAFWRLGVLILPLLALFCLPPAWKIHQSDPDFWRYFIEVEHIQRFTQDTAGQHPQPWYFLIPFIFIGGLPGIIFLPCLLKNNKTAWKNILNWPIYKMAVCGVILPLVFLSFSSGKLPTYILPCFAPLSIIMAGGLMTYLRESPGRRMFDRTLKFWRIFLAVTGVAGIAAAAALAFGAGSYLGKAGKFAGGRDFVVFVAVCGAVMLICGIIQFTLKNHRKSDLMLGFFGSLAILITTVNIFLPDSIAPAKFPERHLRHLKSQTAADDDGKAVIITNTSLMHAVAWCFQRADINVYSGVGEMKYGENQAEIKGEKKLRKSAAEISALLKTPGRPPVIVICRTDKSSPDIPASVKEEYISGNIVLRVY